MNISNHQKGEEYQSIFENATEGIFQSSIKGRYLKVNPAMARIYGYESPEDMVKSVTNISKQIHVDEASRKLFLDKLTKQGQVEGFEARNYRKDGSIIWTRTNARAVQDDEGETLYFEGFLTEITKDKEAELALRESEERYRALVDHLPGVVFLDAHDDSEKTFYVSPKIEDILGYSQTEWTEKINWSDVIHPEDRERVLAESKRTDETGELFFQEYRIQKKDGEYIWIREESSLIKDEQGEPLFWQGFFLDISDQKNAENTLLQSEEKFRQLFEAESDAIFLIDNKSGIILEANTAAATMYGYSKEELLHKKNSDLSAEPEDTRKVTQSTPTNRETVISIPLRHHKKKNGTVFPVEITGRFFKWRGHSVHIAAIRDITNRKIAEEALRASEERFRLAFQTSPDSININRMEDGLFVDANEGFTTLTGYTRENIMGKTLLEINIWDDPNDRAKLVDGLKHNGFVDNLEARFRTKDGRVLTGLMSARIILLDDIPHIISITREIESIKQTEDTLQRQLKELSILHNVALAASSSKSVDELIQRVTDTIGDSLHPDNCGVELLTDDDMLVPHTSYRGATGDVSRWRMDISQGITGKVASTGIPIRLGDVSQEPAYIEATAGVQSELCVPIKVQDRVIGVINIESKKPGAFDEADERLLNTIAGTMATTIEQLRLFETSQRRLKELTILNAVSRASTEAINVDELIENVTRIIGESLYPDNFGMLLINENGTALYPHPSYRGITDEKFPTSIPLGEGISGKVAATGKSLRISNVRKHKSFIEVTSQVRSELCVPIAHGDRILGVINAESLTIDAFTESDEQLLTTISGTLATAIEKLRLIEAEKKRRQDADVLREATTALSTSLDLQTLLETILDNLAKIVPYDSASVAMTNNDKLFILAGRGFPKNYDVIGKQLKSDGLWNSLGKKRGSIIISDAQSDPEFEQWEGSDYIHGWMGVSMVTHDNIIGYIFADSHTQGAFSKNDSTLVETFANSAAVAIENARLFETEQKNRAREEALREATAALTTTIELEVLYKIILNSLSKLIPYDSASIELVNHGYLEIVAENNLPKDYQFIGQKYVYKPEKWKNPVSEHWPLIIPDVRVDERFEKIKGTEYIRSWMGVPMFAQDRLIGFLNLDSRAANFYTQEHAASAQTFGNQAATAIENARLFQEESRRSQIIEAMANITNDFATAQEIMPALEKITQRSLELLQASSTAIYLLQDDDKTIKAVTALGAYHEQLVSVVLQIGTGITGNVIANGKPEIVDDMSKDPRRVTVPNTPEEDAQRDTIMSAPIILRGKTIGAINAWRQRSNGLFNESELNFLVTIANQTSLLIESIRLFQETSRRAQEAHAIAEVGRDISSTLKLNTVLERIAQYAKELLRAETSAIYLSNPDDAQLWAIATFGEDAIEIKNDPLLLGKGILGNIALQKSGEIVNDTLEDDRAVIVKGTDAIPYEHLMGVPVLTNDQLTGLLAVWRTGQGEEFKSFELDFLSGLAQQAAVAIENARLFEAEQRQHHESETLRKTAETITSLLDIRQVLDAILNSFSQVIPFNSAALFLIEGDMVRITAGIGFEDNENVVGSLFPASNALLQELWKTGNPLILGDAQADPRFEKWAVADQVRGWMGVPLTVRGEVIGCITLDNYEAGAYNQHDASLATAFAHQAAAAIENARLFERSEQQIHQLTVLRDIDSAISSSFDLHVVLDLLLEHAVRALEVDAAVILIYDPDIHSLSPYANIGFVNRRSTHWSEQIRIGEGSAGHVVLQRKMVHVADLHNATEFKQSGYSIEENFKCYFGIPLIGKGLIKGVLEVFTKNELHPNKDWLDFLHTLAGQAAIAIDSIQLFKNLQRSSQELILAYDATLAGWGQALELRDKETRGHSDRVVEHTLELARRMGIEGEELTHIMRGTLLHDIGKMGIPDYILHKPGPLTKEEWDIMRQHPQHAFDLMNRIPYLRSATDIPYAHHERWDGSGYPRGLKDEEIPLAARIFAIVDIWDALSNERAYREAWPEDKVIEYIKNAAGIELDPNVVETFLELIEEDNQAEMKTG